ncbi:MAG: hypothetical protein NTW61_09390 [Candidatus Melainabacteria bacterium]|nr:hypothetical protein [Candidatus Melainabacteria bacterium]
MTNFQLPPIGGGDLSHIASKAVQTVRQIGTKDNNYRLIQLPHEIANIPVRSMDDMYSSVSPLVSNIANPLSYFVDLIASHPQAQKTLKLTDLFTSASKHSKNNEWLTNFEKRIDELSGHNSTPYKKIALTSTEEGHVLQTFRYFPNRNGLYSPSDKPAYLLNIASSTQPKGGNCELGIQFGSIPNRFGDLDGQFVRSFEGEEYLAQQLNDLFEAVAKYQ